MPNPIVRRCLDVLVLLLVSAAAGAQPVRVPVYGARKASDPIRVDGRLDEVTWALSPRVGELRLIHDPARRPAAPTEAAVTWDETHLYVAFAATDREAWGRYRTRDDRLWEEEVVEVFLDPDGDGRRYAELEVSPDNVVVDLLIAAAGAAGPAARRWDIAGLQTAVGRHDNGWIVEIAIPWRALGDAGAGGSPRAGDQWRVGLYRIDRPGGPAKAERIAVLLEEAKGASEERKLAITQQVQQLRADDEYSAWSVTRPERGFHDPERFGYVQFLDAGAPTAQAGAPPRQP